jgi:hypothetical protein
LGLVCSHCPWCTCLTSTFNCIKLTLCSIPARLLRSCGHVDSGKSTTTGRLLFELGGIPERELDKLKEEAAALGKQSFAFAFYMDRAKEERERGVTIACTTKEFFTVRGCGITGHLACLSETEGPH